MKTLSIVPVDRSVAVDGVGLVLDFEIDPAIHAVQWNEDSGHIEYKDGRLNEPIDNITSFQSVVALYDIEIYKIKELQRIRDAAGAQEQVERNTFEQTYVYKRQQAYPKIRDQLDMLWHSMDLGEIQKSTEFYTKLKEVKDRYPNTGE